MAESTTAIATCKRCTDRACEYYRYYFDHVYQFDVELGLQIVDDGRETVEVEPDSVRTSVQWSRIHEHHVDHVDPAIPGLIAHVEYTTDDGEVIKGHLLIDGNHRAARCLREDRPFYAYVLTEDESREILTLNPDDDEDESAAGDE